MTVYKGFQKGLICRGYQFHLGKNVTEKADCGEKGFHCAENPLDCLTYYSDMDRSEYYIVNAGGDMDEDGMDTRISCTEITVLKRLSKREFFLHALVYMADHPQREWNGHVRKEAAEAEHGFAIVRGYAPRAKGKTGDILALAKEDPETGKILQIAVAEVDGKKILPGQWYDENLTGRK